MPIFETRSTPSMSRASVLQGRSCGACKGVGSVGTGAAPRLPPWSYINLSQYRTSNDGIGLYPLAPPQSFGEYSCSHSAAVLTRTVFLQHRAVGKWGN